MTEMAREHLTILYGKLFCCVCREDLKSRSSSHLQSAKLGDSKNKHDQDFALHALQKLPGQPQVNKIKLFDTYFKHQCNLTNLLLILEENAYQLTDIPYMTDFVLFILKEEHISRKK